MERKSVMLYFDRLTMLDVMNKEDIADLFLAILSYAQNGKLPNCNPVVSVAFASMKQKLDEDTAKYNERVEARARAGKLGGRGNKKAPSETESAPLPLEEIATADTETAEFCEDEKANALTEKQAKANKANAFSKKQTETKKAQTQSSITNSQGNIDDEDLARARESEIKSALIRLKTKNNLPMDVATDILATVNNNQGSVINGVHVSRGAIFEKILTLVKRAEEDSECLAILTDTISRAAAKCKTGGVTDPCKYTTAALYNVDLEQCLRFRKAAAQQSVEPTYAKYNRED